MSEWANERWANERIPSPAKFIHGVYLIYTLAVLNSSSDCCNKILTWISDSRGSSCLTSLGSSSSRKLKLNNARVVNDRNISLASSSSRTWQLSNARVVHDSNIGLGSSSSRNLQLNNARVVHNSNISLESSISRCSQLMNGWCVYQKVRLIT